MVFLYAAFLMNNQKKHPLIRIIAIIAALILGCGALVSYPGYLLGQYAFNRYFDNWANKLLNLEKKGVLSKKLGAAWQDVLKDEAMQQEAGRLIMRGTALLGDSMGVVDGISVNDYPSLDIIARLNAVQNYSNQILITDRSDKIIARIRTSHTRAKTSEFPETLLKSIVAAEDQNFWNNKTGLDYGTIIRATGLSALNTCKHSGSSRLAELRRSPSRWQSFSFRK
jgi:hypothetical protein